MIPVDQIDITRQTGNCWAACLASIFEVSLDQLPIRTPEMAGDEGWDEYAKLVHREFLNPRGFYIITFNCVPDWKPSGYAILAAQSLRHDCLHAVVCLNGEIVHDPHPERNMGVGEWKQWDILVCLDPYQHDRFLYSPEYHNKES